MATDAQQRLACHLAALQVCRTQQSLHDEAEALLRIATDYLDLGRPLTALEYIRKADPLILQGRTCQDLRYQLHMDEAEARIALGHIEEGLLHMKRALGNLRHIHLRLAVTIRCVVKLAGLYRIRQPLCAAGQAYTWTHLLHTHMRVAVRYEWSTFSTSVRMQVITLHLERFKEAIQHALLGLAVAETYGIEEHEGLRQLSLYRSLGMAQAALNLRPDAEVSLHKALVLAIATGARQDQLTILYILGRSYEHAGKAQAALSHHLRAMRVAAELGRTDEYSRQAAIVAVLHHWLKRPRKAVHYLGGLSSSSDTCAHVW